MQRYVGPGVSTLVVPLALVLGGPAPAAADREQLPDLRAVVPQHLRIVDDGQRELLRFSHGLANTGEGPWRVRATAPLGHGVAAVDAVQEIVDGSGRVLDARPAGRFELHADHGHWHVVGAARFEVRVGSLDGPVYGTGSIESTFCLIDWSRLDGARSPERTFAECAGVTQGVSAGWVDHVYQSGEGPQLDLTGAPAGLYYLVTTSNPEGVFVERDLANNTAWVAFELRRDEHGGRGSAALSVIDHSPCDGGLCGGAPGGRWVGGVRPAVPRSAR